MNAAEEIVKYWYQAQGYFAMESIHLPRNKEIDLLLVKVDGNRVVDKMHVEVQVSNRFANYGKSAQELAAEYHERKFRSVQPAVQKRLGKKYRMVEVRGKVMRGRADLFAAYSACRARQGVEVVSFERVVGDLMRGFGTSTELRPVIQALQYLKFHTYQP